MRTIQGKTNINGWDSVNIFEANLHMGVAGTSPEKQITRQQRYSLKKEQKEENKAK